MVRFGVTVDEDLIAAATNMRIVGRAGTGDGAASLVRSEHGGKDAAATSLQWLAVAICVCVCSDFLCCGLLVAAAFWVSSLFLLLLLLLLSLLAQQVI